MSQRYLGGIITANPTLPTLSSASGVWTLEQDFQNSASITPQVIGRSVRLRSSASAYFNRTQSAPTSSQKATWSMWLKLGKRNSLYDTVYAGSSGSAAAGDMMGFLNNSGGQFRIFFQGSTSGDLITTQLFRDPSSWYHLVVSVDTTQATSSNRVKIYVNGVQVTAFSTATYPTLNYSMTQFFANGNANRIGYNPDTSEYFDGYMTEFYGIDGQALTPSSFGAFDGNGIWQPLSYRGTYGNNGFYLNFSDNSAATATTIGKDYSGNGNNWTPNNISVTAGATYDSMLDVPTNSPDGGTGRGNYATLNPLSKDGSGVTLSNGNLSFSAAAVLAANSTIAYPSSGKWYCEFQVTSTPSNSTNELVGVGDANAAGNVLRAYASNGQYYNGVTFISLGAVWSTNDVIGIAADIDGSLLSFYKNGTLQGTAQSYAFPSNYAPMMRAQVGTSTFVANFGQRPFAYTPPTGFLALNTQNLSAVTINNGAQYMAATLYSGNGSTQTISNGANTPIGTTFAPDFVWIKARNAVANHALFDSVRGTGKVIQSNTTAAEATDSTTLTAFGTSGFSLGAAAGSYVVNTSTYTFVAWQWKAGGTAVSNTSGSITSSVSANTTAGFSVVTYTGNGSSSATVGHGLGVVPNMVIVKQRSGANDWWVKHSSLGSNLMLILDSTSATYNGTLGGGGGIANLTSSSTFGFVQGTSNVDNVNASAATYVAYCWAAVAGYSAFGSYTGNGSADGPFVYCGFRPRYVLYKRSDSTGDWYVWDTSRDTVNVAGNGLFPNYSIAEVAYGTILDILSNGFKLRTNGVVGNSSGATYIYAAFAENPFNIARAR